MTEPNPAEWGFAIRALRRMAAELEESKRRAAAAILTRCAAHMEKIGPRPATLNSAEWAHIDGLIARAFAQARERGAG